MTKPSFSDYGTYDESAYPQLWEGVVAAWCPSLGPTGERLHNLSRVNNWGTLTNMDPATDWVVSDGQYCLDFDGVNDYVSAANTQAFASGTQLTASIWVKRGVTGATHCLLAKWLSTGTSSEDGWILRWFDTNTIWFSTATGGSYGHWISSSAYTNTDWVHIAAVHEFGSSSKTVLYLNGAPIAATWTGGGTQVPDSNATSAPITVGALRYQGGPLQYLNGQADDWAVYNRIMTPNEIQQLYLLGRAGMYKRRRRTARRAAIEQAAAFRAYWARRQNQIIGGGV